MQQKIEEPLLKAQKIISIAQKSSEYPKLNSAVLQTLWNNPIVYSETLRGKLRCDGIELSRVIDELVNSKILHPKKVKNLKQDTVYEATSIMHCWQSIDDLLFIEN